MNQRAAERKSLPALFLLPEWIKRHSEKRKILLHTERKCVIVKADENDPERSLFNELLLAFAPRGRDL